MTRLELWFAHQCLHESPVAVAVQVGFVMVVWCYVAVHVVIAFIHRGTL